jgi:hypothetical protein
MNFYKAYRKSEGRFIIDELVCEGLKANILCQKSLKLEDNVHNFASIFISRVLQVNRFPLPFKRYST